MTELHIVAGHGPGVGAGHLGRCLALAQAWRAVGGTVGLVDDGELPASWVERYEQAGAVLVPADGPRAPIVVVDDYGADAALVARLQTTSRVLLIDDHGTTGPIAADWLLDQNLGATVDGYPLAPPASHLMVGSAYALVRSEITDALSTPPADPRRPPSKLLVAVGGDPSPSLLQAATDAAEALAARHGLEPVWLSGVADVGRCLASVDLAITAAGSTCWDLCVHGVPSVVVAVADNQRLIARVLGTAGAALDAGDLDDATADALVRGVGTLVGSAEARTQLAATARRCVDGGGAARVVAVLQAG